MIVATFTKTPTTGACAGMAIRGQRVTFPTVFSAIDWCAGVAFNATVSDVVLTEEGN